MALCIDTYCLLTEKPSTELLDDYWTTHPETGTLGAPLYKPVLSYSDALAAGRPGH